MVNQERCESFYNRWHIQLDDAEREFTRFKHRLVAVLSDQLSVSTLTASAFNDRFCFLLGVQPAHDWNSLVDNFDLSSKMANFRKLGIHRSIEESENLTEIAEVLQVLFWALEEVAPDLLDSIVEGVQEALNHSHAIGIVLVYHEGKVSLYPAGARELDQALVEQTLIWLDRYPEVAKHFHTALQIYLCQDQEQYRNLLDNLRFAVEQLLQTVLDNQKSLEKQKSPLGKWLKEYGIHSQVRGLFSTLLDRFAHYQNDAVKHQEAYSLPEIELMIYLTGIFLRFILEIE